MSGIQEEIISAEEQQLASELRKCCNLHGEERTDMLAESADILYQMGKLYLAKAMASEKMNQKVNFLKSGVLLVGARIRFLKCGQADEACDVDQALSQLSEALLCSAESEKRGDIFAFSAEVKGRLGEMRNSLKAKLWNMTKISDGLSDGELHNKEEIKIRELKEFNDVSTQYYVSLMRDISQKCIEFLGDPPCRFAAVGLGSLARQEITLYSDFEHVIILEDEAAMRENYHEMKEYFRWYAVLFQTIVIGLGETFIRSIGVKSVNDLYSDDPSKNWFYDVHTPCGVSFDGMVPHSCNNPLGRQEATKTRKHVVELIQPAKKMAKFITYDEEVKNGYYLRDVLSRTSLVYGDNEVYGAFLSESQVTLGSEKMEKLVQEQLEKLESNRNSFIQNLEFGTGVGEINVKSFLYRPFTALLGYYAKICGVAEGSSFAIIQRLYDAGQLGEDFKHFLDFAFAVICEIRARMYSDHGHQRYNLSIQELVAIMGRHSFIACFTASKSLRELLLLRLEATRDTGTCPHWVGQLIVEPYVFFQRKIIEIHVLYYLNNLAEAADMAEALVKDLKDAVRFQKRLQMTIGEENPEIDCSNFSKQLRIGCLIDTMSLLLQIYQALGEKGNQPDNPFLVKAERTGKDLLAMKPHAEFLTICYQELFLVYYQMGQYGEGARMFDRFIEIQTNAESGNVRRPDNAMMQLWERNITMRASIVTHNEEMIDYLSRQISKAPGDLIEATLAKGIAETYVRCSEFDTAKVVLTKSVENVTASASKLQKDALLRFLTSVFVVQLRQKWIKDARVTAKYVVDLMYAMKYYPCQLLGSESEKEEVLIRCENFVDMEDVKKCAHRIESVDNVTARTRLLKDHALAYLQYADSVTNAKRSAFISRCLKIAEQLPASTDCRKLFKIILEAVLKSKDRKKFVSTLSTDILRNKSFLMESYSLLLNFILHCTGKTSLSSLERFGEDHGCLALPVLGGMFDSFLCKIRPTFVSVHTLGENSRAAEVFNKAVKHFACLKFAHCAVLLWWVLNNDNTNGSLRANACKIFLSALYVSAPCRPV